MNVCLVINYNHTLTGNCGIHCCRLNEGFTVFLERKILGRRKGEKMVDFAYIGKSKLAK